MARAMTPRDDLRFVTHDTNSMSVELPPESRRPNGIVHGGALATAVGAGAVMLAGREHDVIGLHIQYLRAASGLEATLRLASLTEHRMLAAVELLDDTGGTCVSGLVRLAHSPRTTTGPHAPVSRDGSPTDIDEPWRRLLGLDISVDGDTCSMSVSSPLDAWWAPIAYATTFADGPGAMLADERKDGAEFVTTALTLDLEEPLRTAMPLAARGRRVGGGGKFRSFASNIECGGAILGFGTATYFRIR